MYHTSITWISPKNCQIIIQVSSTSTKEDISWVESKISSMGGTSAWHKFDKNSQSFCETTPQSSLTGCGKAWQATFLTSVDLTSLHTERSLTELLSNCPKDFSKLCFHHFQAISYSLTSSNMWSVTRKF